MEEFLQREGGEDGRLPIPEANKTTVLNAGSHCEKRAKSKFQCSVCPSSRCALECCVDSLTLVALLFYAGDYSCDALSEYLRSVGHSPTLKATNGCVVFDEDAYHDKKVTPQNQWSATQFCGVSKPVPPKLRE